MLQRIQNIIFKLKEDTSSYKKLVSSFINIGKVQSKYYENPTFQKLVRLNSEEEVSRRI